MWPFKKKQLAALPAAETYTRAKKAGTVDSVQTGVVVVSGKSYEGLRATLVQPGQRVKAGQPIGKK